MSAKRIVVNLLVALALVASLASVAPPSHMAQAVSTTIVISQVYGGGGNSGATLKNDFIELFNRGTTAVSLSGWSVQYASSAGTSWQKTNLTSVSISPGQYYLIQEAAGAGGTVNLPTPDATGTIAMSATGAKVALVNNSTTLAGACPTGASIVDFIGYDGANCSETSPAATLGNTVAALRDLNGCADTDNNAADFAAGSPNPRNTASPLTDCTLPPPPQVHIHDIQGASHISPKNGASVYHVPGIVTALRSNGFYLQDPNPDGDPATSEGIFVFTSSAPTVNVGNAVNVNGLVTEFRPGGSGGLINLTTTEIGSPSVVVLSSGNPLPVPVIIGTGGRIPPATVIEDDATGDVETSGVFDPANDGIDFYESLEGMLVQVNDAVAVGPWHNFGSNREIPVVGDNGANASVRTTRGGVVIQANDFNPERIILNDLISGGPTLPPVNVSDSFPGATLGVMDYSFGNFKLEVTQLPAMVSGGLAQEVTTPTGTNQLAVATFNVENLAPTDPQSKFDTLAGLIVSHLQSPDVIAIEEIQDNNGVTDDGTVDASTTWGKLIVAIQSAGGPAYDYRQIDPVNDQDGGAPGGNIRQGFLFRTDRGLSFIDRPGAGSTTANAVVGSGASTQLQYSPGRIDPTNAAFNTSRKPLAGEFMFNGHHLFVIANHFNSKGGDDPLFGHFQPPTRSSEVQRHQQAQIVHDFVNAIVAADSNADVAVLGDLNDFQFSDTLNILKGTPSLLNTLMDTLPLSEQYSYDFDGNSQAIDHILLGNHLFTTRPFDYDVVHVNSEFANQASDHEPQVSHITLNDPPTVDASGPYSVVEGGSVTVAATGFDLEGGPLSYAWDLDDNGSFETPGQSVTFDASALDGPSSPTIKVQVTDNGGLTGVAQTTVDVSNVAPTAALSNNGPVLSGSPATVSFSNQVDPSMADTAAGFHYAFACDGSSLSAATYASSGASASTACTFNDGPSIHTVRARIIDKDDGYSEYTTMVTVNSARTFYLHGAGGTGNPPTVFLDNTAPTATTEKYKDSASVNFNGGNPWKDVGTWPAAPALAPGALLSLSDLHVWLGLKNSDDQGTKFDLRVEMYKNGTLVASNETYCITGVTRNPALATEVTTSFGAFSSVSFNGTTDVLSLKVLTRIGTNGSDGFCGGHSNAVGLRLYFDAVSRPSRFNATFGP